MDERCASAGGASEKEVRAPSVPRSQARRLRFGMAIILAASCGAAIAADGHRTTLTWGADVRSERGSVARRAITAAERREALEPDRCAIGFHPRALARS